MRKGAGQGKGIVVVPPAAGDDAAAFLEAVRGVRKLGGAARVAASDVAGTEVAGRLGGRPVRRGAAVAGPPIPKPSAALVVEGGGGAWTARADGVDRRTVRRLRDGAISVQADVDLHGCTQVSASQALERFLASSRAAGRRCLLVIHGRGIHSGPEGPTLVDFVRDWLTSGPHTAVVLACASASPSQGGPGATVVYLRR